MSLCTASPIWNWRRSWSGLAHKGVRVRVYRDQEQYRQELDRGGVTTTDLLLAAGVEVRIKGGRDLMHLKSYAIDDRFCEPDRRTGTYRP